jgi:metal-responsive CopG/Arc/MetJ family transcriptional regulator
MKKHTKVAISLPSDMYETIETARVKKGESRSEYFRRAVEKLLKEEQEAKEVESYIASYTANPESGEEIKEVDRLSVQVLVKETW